MCSTGSIKKRDLLIIYQKGVWEKWYFIGGFIFNVMIVVEWKDKPFHSTYVM